MKDLLRPLQVGLLLMSCTSTLTLHAQAAQSLWVNRPPARHILRSRTGSSIAALGARERVMSVQGDGGDVTAKQSIAVAFGENHSAPWSIVVSLTLLTLLPALLLSMTPLVRLLVVFHFLRQALGTQTAPSNQVLMGLALMMTWFLMQPVLLEVERTAVAPYSAGSITGAQAMDLGAAPVKRYMLRYAREKDLAVFASAGMAVRPNRKEDLPIQVVVPA